MLVLNSDHWDRVVGLDTAHYKMLCNQTAAQSEILTAVHLFCFSQQKADLIHTVNGVIICYAVSLVFWGQISEIC